RSWIFFGSYLVIMIGSDRGLPGIKSGSYTQGVKLIKVVIGITKGKSLDLIVVIHSSFGWFLSS
ncbi:hypothetical protein L1D49_04300, partial [Vibrio diabolicus]|nr:hypothetical protein [Vibrio diabolicus]